MKINILGTEYRVIKKAYDTEPEFKERSIDGYCDPLLKEIVYCDMTTFPGWEKEPKERIAISERHTLRHEIVHGFFDESGLQESTFKYDGAWARNEEMIDWMSLNGPKIYRAWIEAGAVLPEDYTVDSREKKPPTWFERAYRENADSAVQRLLEEVKQRMEHPQCDCEFCGARKAMYTWDDAKVELKRVEPLPAFDLTNGKKARCADAPFMALSIEHDDGEDYFPIKYCPICGKYLDASKR